MKLVKRNQALLVLVACSNELGVSNTVDGFALERSLNISGELGRVFAHELGSFKVKRISWLGVHEQEI